MAPRSTGVTDDMPSGAPRRHGRWAPWLPIVGFGVMVVGAGLVAGRPVAAASPAGDVHTHGGVRPVRAVPRAPDREAWIALEARAATVPASATGPWQIAIDSGRRRFVTGEGGERWRIERRGLRLRVAGDGSDATPWRDGPFVARPRDAGSVIDVRGTRYRGELWFTATDSGILVVNRVPVEDYLRGVVPLELGSRDLGDLAALEAQAIAARSYAYTRVSPAGSPPPAGGWHMTATVQFQRYGGADVEHPVVNRAVDATAGLVLRFGNRVIDAPYCSACGGRTAGAREAWREARDRPWLQPVDDIDPRTGRPYCDLSPRNRWRAEISQSVIGAAVERTLRNAGATTVRPVTIHGVRVGERLPSGRAGSLVVGTDRGEVRIGTHTLRDLLRDARGAALASTYFSVVQEARAGGRLDHVTLDGVGYGHGVGMCQWGAIGRARAGASARAILWHYYPGTTVGLVE